MRTEQIDYSKEFASAVLSFKRAVEQGSAQTEAAMAERLSAILDTGRHIEEEHLADLTIFLLSQYDSMLRMRLTVKLLFLGNTPVQALTVACRCSNPKYRGVAIRHPLCPEEDRVYAVLAGIEVLPPWV